MQIRSLFAVIVVMSANAYGTTSSFVTKPVFGSGAANVAPANGGEYVYIQPVADGRVKAKAILVGAVERTDYKFFTLSEERALLAFKNAELAKMVKAVLAKARVRQLKRVRRASLKWPKVVLRGTQVCVPELVSSEADNWKDHLTCYDAAEKSK